MIDYATASGVFSIYGIYPTGTDDDHHITRRLLGRVLIHDGELSILEDYDKILKEFVNDGPIEGRNQFGLNALARNSYMDVVSDNEVKEGHRIDLIPEMDFGPAMIDNQSKIKNPPFAHVLPPAEQLPQEPHQASVFDYFRVGMTKPQVIEIFGNDEFYMNGQKLSHMEIERIEHNVRNGLATLQYRKGLTNG